MRRLILPVVLLSLGTACITSDEMHCAQGSETAPDACIDLYDIDGGIGFAVRASLSQLCLITGSKPKSGACTTKGVVAGCQGDEQEAYTYVKWEYATDEIVTADDVSCEGGEVKVDADRAPVDPGGTDLPDTDTDTDTDT